MDRTRCFIAHRDARGSERVYHLKDSLLVGRAEPCHVLIDREGVSRRHCEFRLAETGVVVIDLESTNGTFLNGTRIREAVVRPGDRIVVGDCTLYLIVPGCEIPSDAPGHTQLLGRTTIETLLDSRAPGLPDARALEDSGLDREALSALYRLTGIVNAAKDLKELLSGALEVFLDLTGMDLACVFKARPEGGDPEVLESLNRSGADRYSPSSTVLNKVLEENVSVVAFDQIGPASVFQARSIADPGTASILCVPLRATGSDRGALYLSSLRRRPPVGEGGLQLLAAMSSQLALAVTNLAHRERLERDNRVLRETLPDADRLVGGSKGLDEIRRLIDRVAATDATVLILGESGTGKELIARALHARSNRGARPLVSLNCGAIPDTMVESELFGHEKGAFTGADSRHTGKFELASEGTLFLDEVGELPAATQVKLLRALEERSFYPLGAEEPVKVDVRIVAATNADLELRVREGAFRNDLLFRLKVFVIRVPPLRDRPEDIPPLVGHFLEGMGGDRPYRVSEAGMERLRTYPWPGNVRELKNVLEREVILADGDLLDLIHMEPASPGGGVTVGDKATLKEAERAHIIRVLRSTGWNKKAAAQVLGIGRPTLYDKIRAHGIREDE